MVIDADAGSPPAVRAVTTHWPTRSASTRPPFGVTLQGPLAAYRIGAALLALAVTVNGLTGQRFGLTDLVNATRTGLGVGVGVGPGRGVGEAAVVGTAEASGEARFESAANSAGDSAAADSAAVAEGEIGTAEESSAGDTTGWAPPALIMTSAIPATAVLRMMAAPRT